jgi:hypothetical protein
LDASSSRIYCITAEGANSCLRQGEILSEVIRFRLDVTNIGTEAFSGAGTRHPYAVILTQDCDLEQDFTVRQKGEVNDKVIPSVLFCEVVTAADLRGGAGINSSIWGQVKLNKHERYHFLQKVEPNCDKLQIGLPELGIDFKRYFTLPTEEVYRRIEISEARRRCVLVSPYKEHLCNRFASFLSRVALPLDHVSD